MARPPKPSAGGDGKPEERVVRLTNMPNNVTDRDTQVFFANYDLVDWKRDESKHGTAYVLIGSKQNVHRVENELDGEELLGRPVRVMKAKKGFKLTKRGLLNERESESEPEPDSKDKSIPDKRASPVDAHPSPEQQIVSNYHQPYVEDETSLEQASSLEPPRRIDSPVLDPLQSPDKRPKQADPNPQNRILLINRLHPEANESAIRLFFNGYNVVDFRRNINASTGKPFPVGFVLLGSMEERNRAMEELKERTLMGRRIELEVCYNGPKATANGFLGAEKTSPRAQSQTSVKFHPPAPKPMEKSGSPQRHILYQASQSRRPDTHDLSPPPKTMHTVAGYPDSKGILERKRAELKDTMMGHNRRDSAQMEASTVTPSKSTVQRSAHPGVAIPHVLLPKKQTSSDQAYSDQLSTSGIVNPAPTRQESINRQRPLEHPQQNPQPLPNHAHSNDRAMLEHVQQPKRQPPPEQMQRDRVVDLERLRRHVNPNRLVPRPSVPLRLPWNLVGNSSSDPQYNVVTEDGWYLWEAEEIARAL